jgi:uncharacterized protein (TIGR02271 family)
MANPFADQVREGMEVWSADGHKLGKVVGVHQETLMLEKGFFFPKDYTVSRDTISEIRDGKVFLSLSRDELGMKPSVLESLTEPPLQSAVRLERAEMGEELRDEEIRVPLHAEEVLARTRTEEVGEIRVRKEVITEERQITVPVMREVVTIERIPANFESVLPMAEGHVFREETITVPVREEVVDIQKRPVVTEEIRISKATVQEVQPVSTTVRREVAEVEEDSGELVPELRKTGTG